MKQIIQNLKNGNTVLEDVPAPVACRGRITIKTTASLVSMGTERMLMEFGKANLLEKARRQPDKVKQVIDKMKTDGIRQTIETVFRRLDEPLPLGYCNVGRVVDCEGRPEGLGFRAGDRVVSNGPHAEMVSVGKNLCAKIPENISDEAAAFTVLASIGLQGIRLAAPTLGEKYVVYGTGLIGLLTVQLLRACGCAVMAVDLSPPRLALAERFGASACNSATADPVAVAGAWTDGVGVDGVIITASAKTDEIVHQAAEMCRKRGKIVLVGVVGLNLRRADFYEKELAFQVSCSYGPGRYDAGYEERGQDYPIGFVRWTEQRNFQAVLDMMAAGSLDVSGLITHRFPLPEAEAAYQALGSDASALGIVLEYPEAMEKSHTIRVGAGKPVSAAAGCVAAMIGAGNYAKMTLAPGLAKTRARLKYVAARTNGAAASYIAGKYGFENATTDLDGIMNDPEVNTIFITTGHSSHGALVRRGLQAGKHVFVEKPLCLTVEELKEIAADCRLPTADSRFLMVGFNRRFSPHTQKIRALLAGRGEPLAMHFSCNAGIIPPNVWVHDPETGGGRIIGEACHFIDLLSHIAGSPVVSVAAVQMGQGVAIREDKMSIVLGFEDGSIGTVNYFGNGAKDYPKETLEIYSEGRILRLENFRKLSGFGFKNFRTFKTSAMDKGHQAEFDAFVNRVAEGGVPLMEMREMVNATLASFAAVTAAREERTIHLIQEYDIR